MKKTVLMSAAKKARIALAVMALCGMSFVGAQEAFAADAATEHPVKIDAKNNIVCGTGAKAEKATGSIVDPANDIVIGVNAIANDKNSIAIGISANAKAENSVAIGYGSVADEANTISFGSAFDDSKNKRLVNLAAGKSNNDAATYGQVITSVKQNGNKLEFYTGTNTTTAAMGVELNYPIKLYGSNLVSNSAKIETDSSAWHGATDNIVMGTNAKASYGYNSDYIHDFNPQYNVVIGASAQAKGVRNIVMGKEAVADGTDGIALGYSASSGGEGIAIGRFSKATYGVAIGGGQAEGSGALAISYGSEAKGLFTNAIGYKTKATDSCAIALGYDSKASKKSSIAFGDQANATAEYSIAMGYVSEASKKNAVAIGYYAKATGVNSIAIIGKANGENSIAIGGTAAEAYSYAIGGKANAKYSVSIGEGSVATDHSTVSVGSGVDNPYGGIYSAPGYRRIVNMADGTNNHDAATFGQIIKKDIYTISLDATGNGNVVLKTNADKEGPTIKVDASALDMQIKQNASDITAVNGKIGTLSADGTYIKKAKNVSENLVALDNQVKRNADDISIANSTIYNVSSKIGTKYDGNYIHAVNPIGSDLVALDKQVKVNADAIGTLTNLTTTEKGNLVGAVNEVKGTADAAQTKANDAFTQANTNKASIGTLTNLTTTEKGNLVGAVNEVKGTADAAQTKANDALGLANTNKASIGTLTNLTTTEKGNLVGAVNEVKGSVDAANTAIAGKADLGLSNINADGETVIKNLAKTEAGAIVNVQLGDLSTEKYYVDAGKKVNENISALDKQVKVNADAIDLKANQELSNINATGENKIKTIAGVVVEGKLGTLTSSNYVDAANTVNANISALDVQVKDSADKITTVDNKIGSLSADGKYIKKAKNVSANLVELDKQVNTNATALTNKANLDLSNINAAGKDVIINLAGNKAGEVLDVKLGAITSTHYVNAGNTVNANISALDTQLNKVENKVGTMTDGNYISAGNTVAGNLSALDAQLKNNTDAIADKADKNLSNITDAGKNVIRDLANEKAGELVDSKLGTITSENYVNAGNTVNANISKLDEQVKANADAINTKADKDLSNITDAGKNVIKDLASVKAGEVVDAKLGDITSNNYVNAGNTVNANISALDKQMKVNTDNIGDTGKLTTAGLGSNLSDAVVNVNNKVGTAEEMKALKDAGLGDNLAQATAAVNKKADKNAEDIKTVNGRVDELGGRVDTLGGAVSKLDTKVNKVGAGAAALAALHPMDFDSDNKLTFAAGVGSYHGAGAAAIGAFYRPSEQVMFSIAGNMGNGENMVNAGVSFALDRPSKTPTTKAALVKTVAAQNEQIAALSETVAEQNEKIARLEAMVEKLAAKQNA